MPKNHKDYHHKRTHRPIFAPRYISLCEKCSRKYNPYHVFYCPWCEEALSLVQETFIRSPKKGPTYYDGR